MISIGLNDTARKKSAELLNILLAHEFVLYTKTLKCHWNVYGQHFGALHEFFKMQYEQLLDIADDVAERVRSLGEFSFGTLEEYHEHSQLPEQPGSYPCDMEMIKWLLQDHEMIIKKIRDDIDITAELHDMGTNNFLCELVEKHEKMAWMLRAHLE